MYIYIYTYISKPLTTHAAHADIILVYCPLADWEIQMNKANDDYTTNTLLYCILYAICYMLHTLCSIFYTLYSLLYTRYSILYYAIIHYTILYYTTLYTILYYTILHYTTLYYTILHYTTLYTTLHYTIHWPNRSSRAAVSHCPGPRHPSARPGGRKGEGVMRAIYN